VTTGLDVAVSSDAYFNTDEIAYRFTYRFDGNLTHAAHVKTLVHAS
jgi:HK97 family phage major capsid protein